MVYCRNQLGYGVVWSKATFATDGESQGGFGILLQEIPKGCIVESTQLHRPNMVRCKLVAGDQQTTLIGEYLTPSTLDHLPDLEEALNRVPCKDPVVLGDLNTYIGHLRNTQHQQVADLLVYFGLMNLVGRSQQRLCYRNLQTWWRVRQGRILQYQRDYFLGPNRRVCKMIGIQYPQKSFIRPLPPLGTIATTTYPIPRGGYLKGRWAFLLALEIGP